MWIFTIALLLVCGLAVRLYLAPVDLRFAQSEVSSRLEGILPGWQIAYQEGTLGWDFIEMRPWVVLSDVTAISAARTARVKVPSLEVSMSRYLLSGQLGIAAVKTDRMQIDLDLGGKEDSGLTPNSDGNQRSLLSETYLEPSGLPRPDAFRPITAFLLTSAETLSQSIPDLENATFNGTSLTVRRGNARLFVMVPRLKAAPDGQDLFLKGDVQGEIGDRPSSLKLEARTDQLQARASLKIFVEDLSPAAIADQFEGLAVASLLHMPVSITMTGQLSEKAGLEEARMQLSLRQGYLEDTELYPVPVPVLDGDISAFYKPGNRAVFIEAMALSLPDSQVQGEGALVWTGKGLRPGVSFEARIDQAPVADLIRYWPFSAYPNGKPKGGRAWLNKHMLDGTVSDVRLSLAVDQSGQGLLAAGSPFEISFAFEDLDSYTLQTLPPVFEARGRGSVRLDTLAIQIEQGQMAGLKVSDSEVRISQLHKVLEQVVDLKLKARGDAQALMTLLDRHPIRAIQRANIPQDRLQGQVDAEGSVRIFIGDIVRRDTEYDFQATLTDLHVSDILGGEGFRSETLALELSRDHVKAFGVGVLNDLPVTLVWFEDIALGRRDPAAQTTKLQATASADASLFQSVRVPLDRYAKGEVTAKAEFTGRTLQLTEGLFEADLSAADLRADEIGWSRAAGHDVRATGHLFLDADGSGSVDDLQLEGTAVDASIDLTWQSGGVGLTAAIDAAELDRNRFTAMVTQTDIDQFQITADAASFDLTPFLGLAENIDTVEAEREAKTTGNDTTAEGSGFTLKGRAESIYMLNETVLTDAEMDLMFGADAPDFAHVVGRFASTGEGLELQLSNAETRDHPFSIETTDAGSFLRGLGYFGNLQGGILRVEGATEGWGKTLVMTARAEGSGATLLPTSALDGGITAGTISGIEDIAGKEGTLLKRIRMPFSYDKGLLDIDKLVANGDSIGLTLKGQMQVDRQQVNMSGVFVPAYGLNSLLGNIPIIGTLFSGGKGEGLFGITYSVKGSMDAPHVQINPASGLAPGFLREIFEGRKGTIDGLTEQDLSPAEAGPAAADESIPISEIRVPEDGAATNPQE